MSNPIVKAAVDAYFAGRAYGPVAARLLANGFDPNALRTNTVLRKDEWKFLDEQIVEITSIRLRGVADLIARGLTFTIPNGMGTTVLEYEDQSDMTDAQLNMDGVSRGKNDRVEYSISQLPLPITHRDFQINARTLASSRTRGMSLDTTQAAIAARKVAEKNEDLLFNGASSYNFGGGTLYGYVDHPDRNEYTIPLAWDDSAKTGTLIVDDVRAMKQLSLSANHGGPWLVYVSSNYEVVLDDDFKAESDKTTRQRIREIEGIDDVKIADKLGDDIVIMVEMAPETVRMVIGMEPTTVEWETEGGMRLFFKVMDIYVPQIRSDQDGNSGLVHGHL